MKSVNPNALRRYKMVADQIARRGVCDRKVLDAMDKVARELFVPQHLQHAAYEDRPLPIGEGQTISQPYMVAAMTEALLLNGGENVLEIGTGSGYAAAVLAHIAGDVHTIERIAALADLARATLQKSGYQAVHVIDGDGTIGWLPAAPYDAIVVTAEGPSVPPSLRAQLKPGGRLVMPLSERGLEQVLVRVIRGTDHDDKLERLYPVRFVPLIGAEGWSPTERSPFDHGASELPRDESGQPSR